MIPKVEFVINRKIDEIMVYRMIQSNDPAGNWNRAKTMGLNKEQFEEIKSKKDYEDAKEIISRIAEPRYKELTDLIKKKKKQSQKEWNKINNSFFEIVEHITKQKWKYQKYKVIISVFHSGLAPREQNFIIRGVNQLPQNRITAHELLMGHLWEILQKYKNRIDEAKLWAINEITTVAILGLEHKLNKLWKNKGYEHFLSNYPQLEKLKILVEDRRLN
jgi:hypothetical protein